MCVCDCFPFSCPFHFIHLHAICAVFTHSQSVYVSCMSMSTLFGRSISGTEKNEIKRRIASHCTQFMWMKKEKISVFFVLFFCLLLVETWLDFHKIDRSEICMNFFSCFFVNSFCYTLVKFAIFFCNLPADCSSFVIQSEFKIKYAHFFTNFLLLCGSVEASQKIRLTHRKKCLLLIFK